MNNKHKHHDVLIAIAEGREVQWLCSDPDGELNNTIGTWHDFNPETEYSPSNCNPYIQWRVKPVPKEPEYLWVNMEYGHPELSVERNDSTIGKVKLEPLDD